MCGSCLMGGTIEGLTSRWLIAQIDVDAVSAVQRELDIIGAIPVGDGAWAVPEAPAFAEGMARIRASVEAVGGSFHCEPVEPGSDRSLFDAFDAARATEWTQLRAACPDGDLEELRRSSDEIRSRDIFSVPEAELADRDLRGAVMSAKLPHLDSNQKPFD